MPEPRISKAALKATAARQSFFMISANRIAKEPSLFRQAPRSKAFFNPSVFIVRLKISNDMVRCAELGGCLLKGAPGRFHFNTYAPENFFPCRTCLPFFGELFWCEFSDLSGHAEFFTLLRRRAEL